MAALAVATNQSQNWGGAAYDIEATWRRAWLLRQTTSNWRGVQLNTATATKSITAKRVKGKETRPEYISLIS